MADPIATFEMPVRCLSLANRRGHWSKHSTSDQEVKGIAEIMARQALNGIEAEFPILFRLTRYGPNALDSDNLATSMKYVRDGICVALGIDDRSTRLKWRHAQETGPYRVVVEVFESEPSVPRLVVE